MVCSKVQSYPGEVLRIAFVPGIIPDTWFRRWRQRHPLIPLESWQVTERGQREVLVCGQADFCFVRSPVDREGLHLIPLYTEQPVVIAPKGYALTAFDELSLADLNEENWVEPADELERVLDLVAAGAGLYLLTQSLARQMNRRELRFRPVLDASCSTVALAWLTGREEPEIEDFIGVVRGRTENSSRGRPSEPQRKEPTRLPREKKPAKSRPSAKRQSQSRRGRPRGHR